MIPEKDPLSITPLTDLQKQNKRPLEITPPATENKIIRNGEQIEASKQLVFTHSEPVTEGALHPNCEFPPNFCSL